MFGFFKPLCLRICNIQLSKSNSEWLYSSQISGIEGSISAEMFKKSAYDSSVCVYSYFCLDTLVQQWMKWCEIVLVQRSRGKECVHDTLLIAAIWSMLYYGCINTVWFYRGPYQTLSNCIIMTFIVLSNCCLLCFPVCQSLQKTYERQKRPFEMCVKCNMCFRLDPLFQRWNCL